MPANTNARHNRRCHRCWLTRAHHQEIPWIHTAPDQVNTAGEVRLKSCIRSVTGACTPGLCGIQPRDPLTYTSRRPCQILQDCNVVGTEESIRRQVQNQQGGSQACTENRRGITDSLGQLKPLCRARRSRYPAPQCYRHSWRRSQMVFSTLTRA